MSRNKYGNKQYFIQISEEAAAVVEEEDCDDNEDSPERFGSKLSIDPKNKLPVKPKSVKKMAKNKIDGINDQGTFSQREINKIVEIIYQIQNGTKEYVQYIRDEIDSPF